VQSRGGKGVINLKTTEGKGKVVSILHVTEQSEVMIITQQGKIIRLESNAIRSVAGTIDLPEDDPDLEQADAYVKGIVDRSIRRPMAVRERPPRGARKLGRRGGR